MKVDEIINLPQKKLNAGLLHVYKTKQKNVTLLGSDWPFLIREALKETASEQGWQANFMSKPHPKVSTVLFFLNSFCYSSNSMLFINNVTDI